MVTRVCAQAEQAAGLGIKKLLFLERLAAGEAMDVACNRVHLWLQHRDKKNSFHWTQYLAVGVKQLGSMQQQQEQLYCCNGNPCSPPKVPV